MTSRGQLQRLPLAWNAATILRHDTGRKGIHTYKYILYSLFHQARLTRMHPAATRQTCDPLPVDRPGQVKMNS